FAYPWSRKLSKLSFGFYELNDAVLHSPLQSEPITSNTNLLCSFTELVEDAYHTYLLFQLSGSVGLICMSALRILVVEPTSLQFYSTLTYLSVMISQLYVCCWSGQELTATSEDLHTVLYKSLWYEQDLRFKRAICFAMRRTMRPMIFRAGHYISLSRQTFVAILRMSYSYFAVLNQTNH
ncbi:odorant receptor 2a-like, partial [Hyposmocoma kahamanoa]|uniref:odorant receptor 2a-like n=1 Tax=Hyposmocoma kahamanoa TaxID=1477025 RepID=UPI000E6D78EE